MKKIALFFSLIALAFALTNCESTDNPLDVSKLDTLATQDVLTAFQIYSDLYNYADKIAKYQKDSLVYNFTFEGIHVTVIPEDTVTYPKTYTMDFTGVADHSGSIVGSLSGKYSAANSIFTLEFANYHGVRRFNC